MRSLCGKPLLLQVCENAGGPSRSRTSDSTPSTPSLAGSTGFSSGRRSACSRSCFNLSCWNEEILWKDLKINVLTSAITLIIIILGYWFTGYETRRPLHFPTDIHRVNFKTRVSTFTPQGQSNRHIVTCSRLFLFFWCSSLDCFWHFHSGD